MTLPVPMTKAGEQPAFFVICEAVRSAVLIRIAILHDRTVCWELFSPATALVERQSTGCARRFFGLFCLADAATGHLPAQE